MELWEFFKTFFLSLINFLLSNYDVSSDANLAISYIEGTYYEFNFLNASDPDIARMNCTFKVELVKEWVCKSWPSFSHLVHI